MLALLFGSLFSGPLTASAHSTAKPVATQTKDKHPERHPLRRFTRDYNSQIVAVIAPQLSLSSAQLTEDLQSGQHVVDIAKDHGVDLGHIKAILVSAIQQVTASETQAGAINQQQANVITTLAQAHPLVVSHVLHRYYTGK